MFYVIDNFLPQEEFKKIYELVVTNDFFPWYLNKGLVHHNDGGYQFTHSLINKKGEIISTFYESFLPFFHKINAERIMKAKINLTTKTSKNEDTEAHIDDERELRACILYLNSNNGYTFFGDKKIMSVENRIVFFNTTFLHGGSTCTDENVRMVLNVNYL